MLPISNRNRERQTNRDTHTDIDITELPDIQERNRHADNILDLSARTLALALCLTSFP